MRRPNSKFSFDPGTSAAMKILTLVVIGCVLVFFGLVYADGDFDPDNPFGEHPWDEVQSPDDSQPPDPPKMTHGITLPWGGFGGWLIIQFPQVKDRDTQKGQVKTNSSDRNQGKFYILF